MPRKKRAAKKLSTSAVARTPVVQEEEPREEAKIVDCPEGYMLNVETGNCEPIVSSALIRSIANSAPEFVGWTYTAQQVEAFRTKYAAFIDKLKAACQ